ncbi:MAG: molybdenum cofactor synthesis domain protein, partial [Deltaproteobacteria bacterium]|nr:molybdenum cofactor synthesis domain protein [Deltaproteobacteria bacterium]
MISVEAALEKILSHIQPLGFEKVSLLESLGRVIGEDIYASRDIPPLDNSAMDGYAVRCEDIQQASQDRPARLEIVEDLPAGSVSKRTLAKGEAIRIMTGAPIPRGADTVVQVEDTAREDRYAQFLKVVPLGENIRRAGEDVSKGERVISKGDLIRPPELGMLASV